MAYKLTTGKTWNEIKNDIREQLARWGAKTYSLERMERKTVRRSWQETPAEAAVTFVGTWPDGHELRLSYNKQARSVDNARVLFLAIEALRLNEVRGINDVMREAYLALPAPAEAVRERDPYEVLELRPGASAEMIEAAYKTLAKSRHPDAGGTSAAFQELQAAYERVKA